jgi:hypothetical protein
MCPHTNNIPRKRERQEDGKGKKVHIEREDILK